MPINNTTSTKKAAIHSGFRSEQIHIRQIEFCDNYKMSNDKGVYNYQNQPQVGFQQVPAQPPSYEQTYPTTSQPQPVRVSK